MALNNSPKSFSNSELQEAVRLCEELQANGVRVTNDLFAQHFSCNKARAEILCKSAEWAVKVKAKGI